MNPTNPWTMHRLAALHGQELKRAAGRARANPRRHRGRWPAPPERGTASAVPKTLGADVLERLAALVALDDA
jgi:hypothetical protein